MVYPNQKSPTTFTYPLTRYIHVKKILAKADQNKLQPVGYGQASRLPRRAKLKYSADTKTTFIS
jgi:hypothetical protein